MTEWMDNVEMAIQKVSHFIIELYIFVTVYLLLKDFITKFTTHGSH
jgi:hypothetical protein